METTKIRVAFHNPKGERGVGKAIVAWTWILAAFWSIPALFKKPPEGFSRWSEYKKALRYNYSHVEIWLSDRDGNFKKIRPFVVLGEFAGRCFSSTTRGNANGVRFAPAFEVIGKHPERWSYIEIEVDTERLEVALAEARRQEGKLYDFFGVGLSFLNPFPIQNDNKWYCSEICNWFLSLCRYTPNKEQLVPWWFKVMKLSKRISPRRMAYVLAKKFHEPIRLK